MARGRRFEIDAVFRAIDRVTRPVTRMQARVGRFARRSKAAMKKVDRAATKVAKTLNKGLKEAFRGATIAAVALGAAVGKVIQTGADFENTLVRAAVKFPGQIRPGTEAFLELEDAARKTGETTEFSASQSAEALKFLAAAGFDAKQSVAALPQVVDMATNAEIGMQEATGILTNTLGAMGLKTKDPIQLMENLARVNDTYVNAANRADMSATEFFESVVKGGAKAKDAGQDIETYAALAGTIADAGIKGADAGTKLKRMFSALTAPVGKAKTALRKYAGDLDDGKGNMIDVVEVIRRLQTSFSGLGTLERSKALKDIFGEIPTVAVSALLSRGADDIDKFRQSLYDLGGASKENAGVIRGTMTGSIDSLKSVVEGFVIDLFKLEDKGIKEVVDGMTEWVRQNKKLIASKIGEFLKFIKENFDDIVKAIKSLAAVVGAIYLVIGAIKAFNAVMAVANVIAAANPIVLIIMAVIAAIALMIIYQDEIVAAWGWLVKKITDYWDYVVDQYRYAGKMLENLWDDTINAIVSAWDAVAGFFKSIWDAIVNIHKTAVNYMLHNGPVSWFIFGATMVIEAWSFLIKFFVHLWAGIFEAVRSGVSAVLSVVTGVVDRIKTVWASLVEILSPIWASITSAMVAFGDRVLGVMLAVVGGIRRAWGRLIDFYAGVFNTIIGIFSIVAEKIQGVWSGMKSFFASLWGGIVGIFTRSIDQIKAAFAPLLGIYRKVVGFKDAMISKHFGTSPAEASDPAAGKVSSPPALRVIQGGRGDTTPEETSVDRAGGFTPQLVSPQERATRSLEERNMTTTNRSEVTIRDESGRAEVTQGELGPGFEMQSTGSF